MVAGITLSLINTLLDAKARDMMWRGKSIRIRQKKKNSMTKSILYIYKDQMKENRMLIPSDQTGCAGLPKKNASPGDSRKKYIENQVLPTRADVVQTWGTFWWNHHQKSLLIRLFLFFLFFPIYFGIVATLPRLERERGNAGPTTLTARTR